jgi:hypothetical protein
VLLFVLLGAGAWYVCGRCAGAGEASLADVFDDLRRLGDEHRRLDNHQAVLEEVDRRIETRARVIEDVKAGRLSLLQAAARFRELGRQPPEVSLELLRLYYPAKSDGECYCRYVIHGVATSVQEQGSPGETILERLEAELQELLRWDGTVRLPERG